MHTAEETGEAYRICILRDSGHLASESRVRVCCVPPDSGEFSNDLIEEKPHSPRRGEERAHFIALLSHRGKQPREAVHVYAKTELDASSRLKVFTGGGRVALEAPAACTDAVSLIALQDKTDLTSAEKATYLLTPSLTPRHVPHRKTTRQLAS